MGKIQNDLSRFLLVLATMNGNVIALNMTVLDNSSHI